ncbi:hypothetical protein M0Q50_10080 [bacterium]|jgi:hypothetical protein|nr:hypothetical protein [bacterium]
MKTLIDKQIDLLNECYNIDKSYDMKIVIDYFEDMKIREMKEMRKKKLKSLYESR